MKWLKHKRTLKIKLYFLTLEYLFWWKHFDYEMVLNNYESVAAKIEMRLLFSDKQGK